MCEQTGKLHAVLERMAAGASAEEALQAVEDEMEEDLDELEDAAELDDIDFGLPGMIKFWI